MRSCCCIYRSLFIFFTDFFFVFLLCWLFSSFLSVTSLLVTASIVYYHVTHQFYSNFSRLQVCMPHLCCMQIFFVHEVMMYWHAFQIMLTFCILSLENILYFNFFIYLKCGCVKANILPGVKLGLCTCWLLLQQSTSSLNVRFFGNPLLAKIEEKEWVC